MAQLPRPLQQWAATSMHAAAGSAQEQDGLGVADLMQYRIAAHQVSSGQRDQAMSSCTATPGAQLRHWTVDKPHSCKICRVSADAAGTWANRVRKIMHSHAQVSADAGLHPMQTPGAARKLARDVMQLHAAAAPHLPAQEKPGSAQGSSKGASKGAKGADAAAEKLSSSVDALPPVAVGALLSTALARGELLSPLVSKAAGGC